MSTEKLDTLDLIINALREHETTLDSLLTQMDRLLDVLGESMIKAQTLEAKMSKLEKQIEKNRNIEETEIRNKRLKQTKKKASKRPPEQE